MALLSTLRHRVYSFISPARTDRDSTSRHSSTGSRLEQRLDRRSMSPATRTKNWLIARNTPSTDSSKGRTPSILGVQGRKKITKRGYHGRSTLSPLAEARCGDERYWDAPLYNKKAAGAIDGDDQNMDDVEKDPDDEEEDAVEDADDDAANLANDTTLVAADDKDDDQANDTTLVTITGAANNDGDDAGANPRFISQAGPSDPAVGINVAQERAEREAAVANAYRADWSDAELALFQRLNMRGFEPLLPGPWRLDFKTIPDSLFTDKDEEVFIGSSTGHDFRAIRAFSSLLTIGIRARDRISTSHSPEEPIRREIENYMRWSDRDAGLNRQNHIPVVAVSTAQEGQATQDVIDNVTAKLKHLAALYRAKWLIHPSVEGNGENDQGDKGKGKGKEKEKQKEPEKDKEPEPEYEHELPTLYGLIIAHTIVSLVTLNATHPDQAVRSIALFDLSDEEHDVWNAFAIAIVVILARNYLVSLRQFDDGQGGPALPQNDNNDPDA